MEKEKMIKKSHIATDILLLLQLSKKIGWNGLKEISITRIIYLSSVLYAFKYPKSTNPFIEDYEFTVKLRGPYCDMITDVLFFLCTNTFIIKDSSNERFVLGECELPKIEKTPNFDLKKEWLETVMFILGIYGEDKIYDFIFRDPEYQNNLQRNESTPINININNKTYIVLDAFKEAFEKTLSEEDIILDDKRYLELYFEYVFSKILKGEENLWEA